MGAWVPILVVAFGCLVVVLIVVMLQLQAATKARLAEMDKKLKLMEAKIRQHDEDIAHLRDQIQHQEPVNPLAAFITSAVAAVAGMKVGKAMLPALGLAALKTFSAHILPMIGRRQKALPKK
jgi:ABC-type Fe3+-citrate transport system substrate-binding protein